MLQRVLLVLATGVLAACTSMPEGPSSVSKAALVDGREMFTTTVSMADEVNILGMTEAMRAFVDDTAGDGVDSVRFKRLTDALTRAGYFDLDYDPSHTLTAEEVFRSRAGNCLSFTNLFVALSRNAHFDVAYQVVDVPPIWDSGDGWVILNNHINVIVRGVRVSTAPAGLGNLHDYVVDFNTVDYRGSFKRHVISDRTAFALYYANVGVEEMRAGNDRNAFANFKRSIETDPEVASTWVDLGALYSHEGHYTYAEAAFRQALALNADDNSALTNLARVYEETGDVKRATEYRARIQQYQDKNPYYHYTWAVSAYQEGNYDRALQQIHAALELKDNDHRFYFLEGLIRYRTGDIGGARSALVKAKHYSEDAAIKQRYASKLAALAANGG